MPTNVDENLKRQLRSAREIKGHVSRRVKIGNGGTKFTVLNLGNSRALDMSREPNVRRTGAQSNRRKVFA